MVAGASFNPKIKLKKKKTAQTVTNESAKPSAIKAKTAGATIKINALRRPIASDIKPLSREPNGCPMCVRVAVNLKEKLHSRHFNFQI